MTNSTANIIVDNNILENVDQYIYLGHKDMKDRVKLVCCIVAELRLVNVFYQKPFLSLWNIGRLFC